MLVGPRAVTRASRDLRADLGPARVVVCPRLEPCERRTGVRVRRLEVSFAERELGEAEVERERGTRGDALLRVGARRREVAELERDLAQVAEVRSPPTRAPGSSDTEAEGLLQRDCALEVAGEPRELAARDERLGEPRHPRRRSRRASVSSAHSRASTSCPCEVGDG